MPDYKPKLSRQDYGWHHRKLPHLDAAQSAQFVTFRLCDSMPKKLLDKWRKAATSDADFRKRIESYLDSGVGKCWLKKRAIASIVRDCLKHFNNVRYELIAWVVMPNHVHILIVLNPDQHLPDILHSIKSYTAQRANRVLGRHGQFWQHESFDRYIRNGRHFAAVRKYIEENPVKAGLCSHPDEWEFSSAFERAQADVEANASRSGKQGCLPLQS
jgi:REP element-mobilizing transposase RayT